MPGFFDPNFFDPGFFDTEQNADEGYSKTTDPETYGTPVYADVLWDTDVYGESLPFEVQASADLAFDYEVLAPAVKNLVITYSIEELTTTQVGDNLEIDYAIGTAGGAHKDLTFSYQVTKASKVHQRGADLKLRFRVTGATKANKSLTFAYTISSPTTVVGRNITFGWVIDPPRTQVGKSLTFDFVTEPPLAVAGITYEFAYSIDEPLTQVGANLQFVSGVEPQILKVGANLQIDAIVEANAVAGADLGFTFEVEQPRPRADLGFGYEVEAATPYVDLTFDYVLNGGAAAIGKDLTFDAPIQTTVASEFDFDAPVEEIEQVGADLAFSASIEGRSRIDRDVVYVPGYVTMPPPRYVPVGSKLRLDWAIAKVTSTTLALDWPITHTRRSSLPLSWTVREIRGADMGFSFEVIDYWEQNLHVLLAEIDPDLVDVVAHR